jgi:predicted  nucleic acid-binding Zn-ribbon protein
MHPDLVKLLELQDKDLALLEADQALDAILAELESLDQQQKTAESAVDQARRAVADATRRRAELETKIEHFKKLDERGRQRLEQVRAPKEIQAVMTELDLARSVLAKEEGEWVKLSDGITALELAAGEAEHRLEQLKQDQEATRQAIGERQAEAERQRETALTARDAAANEVNRALRTRYERLRSVRRRVVVALDGAACGACFTTVPLNRRSQIRAGLLIDACESCGVILYAPDELD